MDAREAGNSQASVAGGGYRDLSISQWHMLAILLLVYACHLADRTIVVVLLDPIKEEFGLSDTQLGLFSGFAFAGGTLLASMPLGTLADRMSRKSLLAGCIAVWSGLTLLCGATSSYAALLLARFGVGAAEAGLQPTSLSMIADAFRPDQRPKAIGLVHLGLPVGTVLGFIVGGWIAGHYGWRMALLVVGTPGLVLALLVAVTLREPARLMPDREAGFDPIDFREFLSVLARNRLLLHVIAGATVMSLCFSSSSAWLASFLVRSHQLSLATVGMILGVTSCLGGIVGGLLYAHFSSPPAQGRRPGRLAVLAIAGALAYLPLGALAVLAENLILVSIALVFQGVCYYQILNSAYSLAVNASDHRIRGRVTALIATGATVIGYGIGPQIVGGLSDLLTPFAGRESLRYALLVSTTINLWTAGHFWFAYRHLDKTQASESV